VKELAKLGDSPQKGLLFGRCTGMYEVPKAHRPKGGVTSERNGPKDMLEEGLTK